MEDYEMKYPKYCPHFRDVCKMEKCVAYSIEEVGKYPTRKPFCWALHVPITYQGEK